MLSAAMQDFARLCSEARQLFLLYTFARAPAPYTGTETRRFILSAGFVDQWNGPHNRSDTYGNSSQMPKSLFTHNLSWLTRCPALAHNSWQRYHSAALNRKSVISSCITCSANARTCSASKFWCGPVKALLLVYLFFLRISNKYF